MPDTAPGLGHNGPPLTMPQIDIAEVRQALEVDFAEIGRRADELFAGYRRWHDAHLVNGAPFISDETTQGKTADFLRQCRQHLETIEETRISIKRPFLEGERAVDGFFGSMKSFLDEAIREMNRALTGYAAAKQREARVKAEAERQAALDNAAKAAAKAVASNDQAGLQQALEAEEEALSRPVEVSNKAARTVGDFGAKVGLRGKWKARIIDANAVPRQFTSPDLRLIEAAMESSRPNKKSQPTITIPGVEFYFEQKATVT